MPKPQRQLYDAFPARSQAASAAADLQCGAVVRKLRKPQDGGRLKYGVYAPPNCARTIAYQNAVDLKSLPAGRGSSLNPWGPSGGPHAHFTRRPLGNSKSIVDAIRAGDRVTIVDRFGQQRTGRAVMRGPAGWVLNMGGRHGTPGIASDDNITKVSPKKR